MNAKSVGFFIFLLILGAIAGTLLGDIIGTAFPILNFLKNYYLIGTASPVNLNLKVVSFEIGVNFTVNIMTIFGMILGMVLYKKY